MSLPVYRYTVRVTASLFAVALLVSCGSSGPKAVPQLHLACQTVECECRGEKTPLFGDRETTEILWRLNGDASCPKGFVLERVSVDFLGRRR